MRKIDFHVHIQDPIPVEKMAEYFRNMMEENGYDAIGIMALSLHSEPGNTPDTNDKAMALKKMLPGSYAFAAPDHDSSVSFRDQLEQFMAQRFDGVKLIEGKPNLIKRLGYGANDPRFDGLYELAEEKGFPIMLHVGDPAFSWDLSKATPRMIEKGWVYDDSYVTFESGFDMIRGILTRYPRLKIAFAHMGFMADRLEMAAELLDRHPNMMLDITPALPIYKDLSADPEKTRNFFLKYQDRLIYGTDAACELKGDALAYNRKKVKIVRNLLEGECDAQIEDYFIRSLHLPEEVLTKVYAGNAIAWCGEPK